MTGIERRRNLHLARMLQWVTLAVTFFLLLLPDFIAALKDVSVTIPQAVKRGSNALLICNYDMENDTLYSVKWYKGRREFYRYTPKENPAMKVFPVTSGLDVERNLSNQSHVVLLSVALNVSGKFTCEISVEAPSFQTAMVSGEMEVVELPEQQATVTGIQPRYRIGDLVDGNCSIKFSKPAANLTWTINGIVVPPHHIKTYQIEKYEEHNLESVMSAINFMVTTQHFHKGQMKLKCTASIFDIYKEEIENVIEEDRPRIMASGRSYDMNAYPYDQHSSGDGFEDHNESYLTYYSAADMASSSAPRARSKYVELLRQWHRYWTNLLTSASSSPSTAPAAAAAGDKEASGIGEKKQSMATVAEATTTKIGSNSSWPSSLSSIKRNVKRCVDDISRRFKTQIENAMASMTSRPKERTREGKGKKMMMEVRPTRKVMETKPSTMVMEVMEARTMEESRTIPRNEMEINTRAHRRIHHRKSSLSLFAHALADVDDDEGGDTDDDGDDDVDTSNGNGTDDDDRWRLRRCTRNAIVVVGIAGAVGGLSLVLLLGGQRRHLARPVKAMKEDEVKESMAKVEEESKEGVTKEEDSVKKELMMEDSRSCQNKARVRRAAKWRRANASASNQAPAPASNPPRASSSGSCLGPGLVDPVDGFNDFLSRDHEYTLQDIQAMKSFYNCHGSNSSKEDEDEATPEAKWLRRDLRMLAKETMAMTTTSKMMATTSKEKVERAEEKKKKNCHYALACQRQLSMMLLPSNNGEKYRNRNFAWSDVVVDALLMMSGERVMKTMEVGGGGGEKEEFAARYGARSLPVDGQVSKLPIMLLRQRQQQRQKRVQDACQQC